MKKQISAFLAALMLASALTACASDPAQSGSDTTPAVSGETEPAVTEPVETGREDAKDNLPADLKFNGETINVIYRGEDYYQKWDMVGTDNTGEIIQDAIWERNRNVETRLNIIFNFQRTAKSSLNDVKTELSALVLAGSDEFDIISSTANTTVQASLYPYLYELSDLKYVDITQPWWRTSGIKELSFDGENFRFLMGDHTLNDYLKCGVMYYNKDMYTDVTQKDGDELYQDVLDGTWTWDDVITLTTKAYADLNGDGTANAGDRFGLMIPQNYTEATVHMLYACDPIDAKRTPDGIDLSTINNEKNISIVDLLIKVTHNPTGVYVSDKNIDKSPEYFAQNRALLWTGRLTNATAATMREMESDYGILPMPKYNEEQEEYITLIHTSSTVTCLPKTIKANRIDTVDAVLEAWASEAYRTVITPFIETALKMKYSRDAKSAQVIDIIFDDPMISFTDMYSSQVNSIISNALLKGITNGENTFASAIAERLPTGQTKLNDYLAELKKSEG